MAVMGDRPAGFMAAGRPLEMTFLPCLVTPTKLAGGLMRRTFLATAAGLFLIGAGIAPRLLVPAANAQTARPENYYLRVSDRIRERLSSPLTEDPSYMQFFTMNLPPSPVSENVKRCVDSPESRTSKITNETIVSELNDVLKCTPKFGVNIGGQNINSDYQYVIIERRHTSDWKDYTNKYDSVSLRGKLTDITNIEKLKSIFDSRVNYFNLSVQSEIENVKREGFEALAYGKIRLEELDEQGIKYLDGFYAGSFVMYYAIYDNGGYEIAYRNCRVGGWYNRICSKFSYGFVRKK